MSILVLILIFSSICFVTASTKKNQESFIEGTRFRGVQCKTDNLTVELKYCYIKAYSRKTSLLSIGVNFLNPIHKPIYVQVVSNYHFGSGYREVFNTGKQEWCSAMEETTNPIMKAVIEVVKDNPVSKELFHPCPYEGDLQIKNFSTSTLKLYDALPAGLYRFDVNAFKDEKLIFSLKLSEEVKKDL